MRVLILGAGFGGLELTSSLSERFGNDADVVLIDQSDGFVFGFSKLDVMFGKQTSDEVFHPYSAIGKPGVRFVKSVIRSIDPESKRVETDAGTFDGDVLVVALGADLRTVGYSWPRRMRLRVLHSRWSLRSTGRAHEFPRR